MRETAYRASRMCRILGNPVVFGIVAQLLDHRDGLTPSQLSRSLRRSVQTVSTHLAKLRTADLVRYDTDGRRTRYRLKHPHAICQLVEALHGIVAGTARMPD